VTATAHALPPSGPDLDDAVARRGASGPKRRAGTALARREGRAAYLFLLPWFAGLVLITVGPVLASLYLSFTNYHILQSPTWVGFKNYRTMFADDPRYLQSIRVTVTYVAISVPLVLCFALGLAVVLNRGIRLLNFYRALFYLPSLLGSSAALVLLWRQVFGFRGIVNRVLGVFGVQGPSWLGDPSTAIYTLIFLHVWAFGSAMIIFLAGLRQIPAELYDAAKIDGAGQVKIFLKITLPLLSPIILFNTVLNIITSFQAFTSAYVISNGTGGPADSTLFYTLYLYQQGFTNFNMGYACAMAWILLVAIALATAIIFRFTRRWVHYEEGR
jgi:multiple sugar transport system permease protein